MSDQSAERPTKLLLDGVTVGEDLLLSELFTKGSPVKIDGLTYEEQYLLGIQPSKINDERIYFTNYVNDVTHDRAGICRAGAMNMIIGYDESDKAQRVTIRFDQINSLAPKYNALTISFDRDPNTNVINGINLDGFILTETAQKIPHLKSLELYGLNRSITDFFMLMGTRLALEIEGTEITEDMDLEVHLGEATITTVTIEK